MMRTLFTGKILWTFYIFCLVFISFFSLFFFSLAQTTEGNIVIRSNTEFPKPHQTVSLRAESFSVDLDRSTLFWYVNDKLVSKGRGERLFTFTLGNVGDRKNVLLSVKTTSGKTYSMRQSFAPQGLSVIWEALSNTPAFYKGKALSGASGLVLVTVIPEFITANKRHIDPKTLVYTWEQDGFVLGSASGVGKDSVVVRAARVVGLSTNISVVVNTFDNSLLSKTNISIPSVPTEIVLYEKHPLIGTRYERGLSGTFALLNEEVVLRGEPYYFASDDIASNKLRYRWQINNRDISIPLDEQRGEMTFRKEGDSGSANISLRIENFNLEKVLQDSLAGITIAFE